MSIFGDPEYWPDDDLIGWSEEPTPEMLVAGYREGVFPMPIEDVFGWFSPLNRAIVPLHGMHISRSLRRSARKYTISSNRACAEVIRRCADPTRPGWWISDDITRLYLELHRLGFVHSIEVWDEQGRLAGGLYGVRVGRLFAGESMFHDPEYGTDASKVALMALVFTMQRIGDVLLDVQWQTPHLESLGAIEMPREIYLRAAAHAAARPGGPWPAQPPWTGSPPG
ncbi:leucyl/phenylalanyl-tRNA--protein transferase [Enemella sp. A6]|uniref:leucyl/phenylalanyl-tRNA--protein transferase n=1 Tax=Enemella sp. A6 TaxID=3440152 RepID=UPI003EB72605